MKRNFFVCVFKIWLLWQPEKIYTRKELVAMKTSIADFHTSFYIPPIQKLAFHLPHVHVLGNNHCGNTHREAFNCQSSKQDVFCCCDYSERVVTSLHTKYSINTIAEIYLCLLKALHWITLVHQHVQKQKEQHNHTHVILCFINFCLMTANRILPQILYTENLSLNCWSNATLCLIH